MSRLEEIKDEVAREDGFSNFKEMCFCDAVYAHVVDKVAKRYARECCIARQDKIVENIDIEGCYFRGEQESITNESNIVML